MATIKLPYLCSDKDRHGNVRYYVRREGKKSRIRGTPGSVEFQVQYQKAVTGAPTASSGSVRLGPGTFGRMVHAYLASPDFRDLNAQNTQPTRRRLLHKLVATHGHLKASNITEQAFKDGLANRKGYGAKKNYHGTLRGLYGWAMENKHVSLDPTANVPLKRKKTAGFHTWTEEESEIFEERWPLGTKPRLAYELARQTGARVSNLNRLGPNNVSKSKISFRVKKNEDNTYIVVTVPISARLQAALNAGPLGAKRFLETEYGKPFSDKGMSYAFRKWCDAAGLPQCSGHGIRKFLATSLAHSSAGDLEIMAVLGHETPLQAAQYTKAANREKMAANALNRLAGEQSVPPAAPGGTTATAGI